MLIKDIKCGPPFNELFPVDRKVVEGLKESISRHGFSDAEPVIIWRGKDILVDGHLRYLAAKELGYINVPAFHMNFPNEEAALRYAIQRQTLRRNLTDAEIMRCIEALDRRKKQGEEQERHKGRFQPKASNEAIGKSAQETAKTVGVSRAKVERARTVLNHADEEIKAAVKEGKISINRAYRITRGKAAAAPPEPDQAQAAPAHSQATATAAVDPAPAQAADTQSGRRKQELRQALEELLAWRQRYRHLFELGNIFAAIDACELCQVRLVK